MNIVIRVDASKKIGTGHVMRCLALANGLRDQGGRIRFFCRDHPGNMTTKIQQCGFECSIFPTSEVNYLSDQDGLHHAHWLGASWKTDAEETIHAIGPKKIDWLIVDHYGLDYRWHEKLRFVAHNIMVIDDLADRKFDCDLLLDQTYGRDEVAYRELVPINCKLLLGPQYALVRPEFARLRTIAFRKRKSFVIINRIFIFMGGVDSDNMTGKVLDALTHLKWKKKPIIDVVMGGQAPCLDSIIQKAKLYPLQINILVNADNMAELMLEADFAIGAAGTTSWERCLLGLPTAAIGLAENQKTILRNLEDAGAHIVLNIPKNHTIKVFADALEILVNNRKTIKDMADKSFDICDGRGVGRVGVDLMPYKAKDGQPIGFRKAENSDSKIIYDWQSHAATRKYANNPGVPAWHDHIEWILEKVKCSFSYFFIILHGKVPAGVLRFDQINFEREEGFLVSIFIAPEKYRLGIASGALEMGKVIFAENILFARILEENCASISLFKKAGFKYRNDIEHYEWRRIVSG